MKTTAQFKRINKVNAYWLVAVKDSAGKVLFSTTRENKAQAVAEANEFKRVSRPFNKNAGAIVWMPW